MPHSTMFCGNEYSTKVPGENFREFFARKILWNFTSLQQYRSIPQRLAGKKRWCSLLRTKWISTTAFRDAVNKFESPPFAVCCDLSVTVRPQSHAKHKKRPTVIPLPTGERSIVMSVSVCLSVCPCLCVCVCLLRPCLGNYKSDLQGRECHLCQVAGNTVWSHVACEFP